MWFMLVVSIGLSAHLCGAVSQPAVSSGLGIRIAKEWRSFKNKKLVKPVLGAVGASAAAILIATLAMRARRQSNENRETQKEKLEGKATASHDPNLKFRSTHRPHRPDGYDALPFIIGGGYSRIIYKQKQWYLVTEPERLLGMAFAAGTVPSNPFFDNFVVSGSSKEGILLISYLSLFKHLSSDEIKEGIQIYGFSPPINDDYSTVCLGVKKSLGRSYIIWPGGSTTEISDQEPHFHDQTIGLWFYFTDYSLIKQLSLWAHKYSVKSV